MDVGTQQYAILDRVGIGAEIRRDVSGFQKRDHWTARDRTAATIRFEQRLPELALSTALDDFERPSARIALGEIRHGTCAEPPDVRFLIGRDVFDSLDGALHVSQLARVVYVRGMPWLVTLVELLNDESRARKLQAVV